MILLVTAVKIRNKNTTVECTCHVNSRKQYITVILLQPVLSGMPCTHMFSVHRVAVETVNSLANIKL